MREDRLTSKGEVLQHVYDQFYLGSNIRLMFVDSVERDGFDCFRNGLSLYEDAGNVFYS